MKFGKILLTALVCGLFLLLLSALVVTPETETVLPEPQPLTGLQMSARALPVCGDGGETARWGLVLAALFFCAPLCLLPRLSLSRTPTAGCCVGARYLEEAYLLFRQDVGLRLISSDFLSATAENKIIQNKIRMKDG